MFNKCIKEIEGFIEFLDERNPFLSSLLTGCLMLLVIIAGAASILLFIAFIPHTIYLAIGIILLGIHYYWKEYKNGE